MPTTLTLLIVDDDEDDKEMLKEVITEICEEVTCITVSNGQEAIQLLKKEDIRPDYIFLDLNMPRLNGFQCLKQLKNNAALSAIPVVIYTTSNTKEDKEQTINSGAAYFITKPTSSEDLKKELQHVFSTIC